jgi:uridine kinase
MSARDGTVPDPRHASLRRYVEAQQIYFRECSPHQRASVLIDNSVLETPRLVRLR